MTADDARPCLWEVVFESRGPPDPTRRTTLRVQLVATDQHDALASALEHVRRPFALWRIPSVHQVGQGL